MPIGENHFSRIQINEMLKDMGIDPDSRVAEIAIKNNFICDVPAHEKAPPDAEVWVESPNAVAFNPLLFGMAAELVDATGMSAYEAVLSSRTQLNL